MLTLSTCLTHYKRNDIQKEIILHVKNREVAFRFGEKGFGKRPDILQYDRDILELAKQGVTSFHTSEELWENPLQLDPGLKKSELDSMRIGWDLVLDIDCPSWKISKIIAWLIIKALTDHGILSCSIKFSGNKGFHIGVPFEAFPAQVNNTETRLLFPDGPKRIALYLLDYISKKYIKVTQENDIIFGDKFKVGNLHINKIKTKDKLMENFCKECGKKLTLKDTTEKIEYVCPKCTERSILEENAPYIKCPKCGYPFMENMKRKFSKRLEQSKTSICSCGSTSYEERINPLAIIEVDTLLISSRHLYRMPYSLHEKSGLCSIPFNPQNVLKFEKKYAKAENLKVSSFRFLDRKSAQQNEARQLLMQAMDFSIKEEETKIVETKAYDVPETAIPELFFPPCMLKGLNGIEDGKKRFLFALVNFLSCVGWSYDKIETFVYEWNKKNVEGLREVYIVGHLRYHKQRNQKILPPNCRDFYKELGICFPDNLCDKIKNPASYARRKTKFIQKESNK
jgi:DNA-directed RNA polymerase subunit RPC12/RpoP